jgi:ribosomal protein S18 acetylase RimI-like enzyme
VLRRPATEDDRDAVLGLAVAEERAWFGAPETEPAEVREWIEDAGGVTAGVVVVADAGSVLGFAAPGRDDAVLLAEPAQAVSVVGHLLPWLLERRADSRLMVFAGDAERCAALERGGLRSLYSSFWLLRPPEAGALPAPAVPDGVEVAPYRLGDDDAAVHRLIYSDAAWGSVRGHRVRDLPAWRETVRACGTLLLARRDGRPVGWLAGRLLDSGRGHVRALAVAADEQRRGLGRALLVRGLRDLERAGARGLTLDAVAHNVTALGLYTSLGFAVEREWRTYGREP